MFWEQSKKSHTVVVFIVPHIGEWLVGKIVDLNEALSDFIKV